jgi:hypothetical protein
MPSVAYKELLTAIPFKSYWMCLTDGRLAERCEYTCRGLPSLRPRSYRLGAVLKQVSFGPDIYNDYYLSLGLEHIKCFIRDSLVSLP